MAFDILTKLYSHLLQWTELRVHHIRKGYWRRADKNAHLVFEFHRDINKTMSSFFFNRSIYDRVQKLVEHDNQRLHVWPCSLRRRDVYRKLERIKGKNTQYEFCETSTGAIGVFWGEKKQSRPLKDAMVSYIIIKVIWHIHQCALRRNLLLLRSVQILFHGTSLPLIWKFG